jgi:hypothetical protein
VGRWILIFGKLNILSFKKLINFSVASMADLWSFDGTTWQLANNASSVEANFTQLYSQGTHTNFIIFIFIVFFLRCTWRIRVGYLLG